MGNEAVNGITLRKMQADDIQAIMEITAEAWEGYTMHALLEERHGIIGGRGWKERKSDEIRNFCESQPENVLVACMDGRVVGYATFSIVAADGVGHVLNNAVAPSSRGHGIGSLMNRGVIDAFKRNGVRVAIVSTMESDKPAQRVYEKQGFKEMSRSIHYSLDLR